MHKELLTIQDIKIDLKYKIFFEWISLISLLFIFLFFLAISFLGFSLLKRYTEFLVIVFAPPAIVLAFVLAKMISIIKLYIVRSKKLCIVEDALVGMDSWHRRYQYIRRTQYNLYFAGYGRYTILENHYQHSKKNYMTKESVYNSSNSKDEFYLVLTKEHTGKIVMVYNKKFFEFDYNID